MRIGGLQKLSLIDYPGKIAAIVFTQGCNFRCPFCHNPELVIPEKFGAQIPEDDVLDFLRDRRNYLQGVVVSGGEPTQQGDLVAFLNKLKDMNYLVKLDTNGSRPDTLKVLMQLKLVDYFAMDVKTSFKKYHEAINIQFPVDRIKESIRLIIGSGLPHEFRTTAVKSFCTWDDLIEVEEFVQESKKYKIQKFQHYDNILDPKLLSKENYTEKEIDVFNQLLAIDEYKRAEDAK